MFFDEIHKINNWEEAIHSYRVDFDSDIYVLDLMSEYWAELIEQHYLKDTLL